MRFEFEHLIELPRAALFAFHENPGHLVLLYRGWSRVRVLHHAGNVRPGSRTWVECTVAGIMPVVMGFEHTVYEPPRRFGERIVHGPFSRFTHIHEFVEENGATRVRDLLDVELPWCYGGEAGMRLLIAPMVRRAFRLRAAALSGLAQTGVIAAQAGRVS